MATKVYLLLFALITLVLINTNDGFLTRWFKFGDENRDNYLTMEEFNKAAEDDENWSIDGEEFEDVMNYNLMPIPESLTETMDCRNKRKCYGLAQEDFALYHRESMKGTCNYFIYLM